MPDFTRRYPALLLVVAGLLCAMPAAGDEVDDLVSLHRSGQTQSALQRLEQALAAAPSSLRLRFLKAVWLAESGRTAEAAALYLQLTQQFPEVPEPFNNLAVLYAAEGRLDEAREALQAALRNDPRYATAHENLGDVYVQLALRSYRQADAGSTDLPRKLRLALELLQRPAAVGRP